MLHNTHLPSPVPLPPNNTPPDGKPSSGGHDVAASPRKGLSNSHKPAASGLALSTAIGGTWSKLTHRSCLPPRKVRWRRGRIKGYSVKSRSRLIQSMCQTDMRAVAGDIQFTTLTYPGDWNPDPSLWHAHLESFCDKLCRRWAGCFTYWKLEFQRRGAPHFHLLIFNLPIGVKLRPRYKRWVSRAWAASVGSPDPKHVRAGTNVQWVESVRKVKRYASKYVGKTEDQLPDGFNGRIWGIHNRAARSTSLVEAPVSEGEFFALRRSFRRYMGACRGFHRPGGSDSGCWAAISAGSSKRLLGYFADPVDRDSGIIGEVFGWTEGGGAFHDTPPPMVRIARLQGL